MKHMHGKLALSLFTALALAACDGGTGSAGGSRVSVRLTDAPGDLKEAWVKVDRIYLKGGADSINGGNADLLTTRTGWVDLLTLSGGRTAELVNGVTVPGGRYSEMRFVVCEAYVVTREGDVYASRDAALPAGVTADGTLQMPSACSSGFKVKFPADSSLNLQGESTIVTVDFDVSQSFGHQAGNSGRWIMHPVLQATSVGFSGGIAGTVAVAQGLALPTCGGAPVALTAFVPQATAGATTYSSAVGTDGRYRITVPGGTYTMAYAPALSFANGDSLMVTATPAPATATVGSGATATVDYTVTAATCKPKA
ncbi:DUF4382 domain-containing protein [Longimicrobium sp.]|uniref:DUF4382 domain-containing protein n=1 Tax=Longimicrobium sp. TaxID=2029185 RepID=UPI002E366CDA|nr:DUF4382 domain-containing protein [Longimicrobium sp.]HEX6041269.1 DUF4382 domain-containing protein [Longimicrobium sp.]